MVGWNLQTCLSMYNISNTEPFRFKRQNVAIDCLLKLPNTAKSESRKLKTASSYQRPGQVGSSPDPPAGWGQCHLQRVPHHWYHITLSCRLLSHWPTISYLNRDLTVRRGYVLTLGVAFLLIGRQQAHAPPASCNCAGIACRQGLGSHVVAVVVAVSFSFACRESVNDWGRSQWGRAASLLWSRKLLY